MTLTGLASYFLLILKLSGSLDISYLLVCLPLFLGMAFQFAVLLFKNA